jgi:hypothetical protein
MSFQGIDATNGYTAIRINGNNVDSNSYNHIRFDTYGSERMRIDSSGNVGVSVTPSAWGTNKAIQIERGSLTSYQNVQLDVAQNCYYDGSNWRYIGSDQASKYAQVDGSHRWFIASSGTAGNTISFSEAMRIDSSGRVGIGTSSPGGRLDITGAGGGSGVTFKTTDASLNETFYIADGGRVGVRYAAFSVGIPRTTSLATNAVFQVEEAGLLTVLSTGNVGIGRSSPACPLDVSSASTADNSLIAQFQPTVGANGLTIRRYNVGADNDRTGLYFQNEGVINTRLWVDDTGDVRVSGSTPTSDTSGTVVGTQTFTGTHIYKTDETDLEIGEAVCLVGKKIVRSSSAKSKTVAGIYAGESWKVVDSFGDKCRDADGQPVNGAGHAVIALGDTRFFQSGSTSVGVLVDGPVQAGDLLCTSSVPGRLTVQEDDLMHSYTVAKAMEDGDNTAPIYAYVYSG